MKTPTRETPTLPRRCAPTEVEVATSSPVTLVKNTECSHYEKCLDVAVYRNWSAWTCKGCPFQKEKGGQLLLKDFADRRRPLDVL